MSAFRLRPLTGNEPRSLTVNVVRCTPQAVLIETVDEARYRTLVTDDGRVLVEGVAHGRRTALLAPVLGGRPDGHIPGGGEPGSDI